MICYQRENQPEPCFCEMFVCCFCFLPDGCGRGFFLGQFRLRQTRGAILWWQSVWERCVSEFVQPFLRRLSYVRRRRLAVVNRDEFYCGRFSFFTSIREKNREPGQATGTLGLGFQICTYLLLYYDRDGDLQKSPHRSDVAAATPK